MGLRGFLMVAVFAVGAGGCATSGEVQELSDRVASAEASAQAAREAAESAALDAQAARDAAAAAQERAVAAEAQAAAAAEKTERLYQRTLRK